jgi:predicted amidohydrolase
MRGTVLAVLVPERGVGGKNGRMEPITAVCLQLAPEPGPISDQGVAAAGERAASWVERCVEATGADLVVLPESATTGYHPGAEADALWDAVSEIPGPVTDPLAAVARRLGVHLVWGTYERGPARGQVFNSAAVIGPTGEVLGVYRKTHLFVAERREAGGWAEPGDRSLVVETELGRLGVVICFDGDFPELTRLLAVQRAEVIVRPSAFMRSADIWELTNRARAYDNHTFVVATNAVGRDPGGLLYFGNSMIVGPTAEVLARGTSQEQWVAARLDPATFAAISPGSSVPQVFDHLEDRNLDLYAKHADDLVGEARAAFPHPDFERPA